MKKNMGSNDRTIRVIIAFILLILSAAGIVTGTISITLMVIAVIFVFTSMIEICPIYLPFGINTCKKPAREQD